MRLRPPSPNRSAELEPVRVNMRTLFLVGTSLWLGGAVVIAILAAASVVGPEVLAVCGVGVAIGVGGWLWSRWRRW